MRRKEQRQHIEWASRKLAKKGGIDVGAWVSLFVSEVFFLSGKVMSDPCCWRSRWTLSDGKRNNTHVISSSIWACCVDPMPWRREASGPETRGGGVRLSGLSRARYIVPVVDTRHSNNVYEAGHSYCDEKKKKKTVFFSEIVTFAMHTRATRGRSGGVWRKRTIWCLPSRLPHCPLHRTHAVRAKKKVAPIIFCSFFSLTSHDALLIVECVVGRALCVKRERLTVSLQEISFEKRSQFSLVVFWERTRTEAPITQGCTLRFIARNEGLPCVTSYFAVTQIASPVVKIPPYIVETHWKMCRRRRVATWQRSQPVDNQSWTVYKL